MKKQLRRLIVLIIALAISGCVAALLLTGPEKKAPQTESASTIDSPLPKQNLKRAEVQNSHGSYRMTLDTISGLPAELVEMALLKTVFDGLNALELERVEGASAKEAVYGVEMPASRITLHYAETESHHLKIGIREGVSKRYYCAVDGSDSLYLMDGLLAERLMTPVQNYLSLQVTPECLAISPLGAIGDISFVTAESEICIRSAGDPDSSFARELLSFGAVTHVVKGPGILHELDRTYATEIFGSLLDLYAQDIIAYGLSEAELLEKGFAQPDLIVSFDLKNSDKPDTPVYKYKLRLLHKEDGSHWAAVNARGIIYRIAGAAFMKANYAGFVDRWFLSPLLVDLKALRITTLEGQYLYEIGGTPSNLYIKKQGREVPLDRFRSFYNLVVSAASNGDYLGLVQTEGSGSLRVEFIYRDELKSPDVLEFYELDDRRYAVAVNSVTEFAMRRNYAQTVAGAIVALETGADIPQNW